MHSPSLKTINPRMATMPERSTSGLHRPGIVGGGTSHLEVWSESGDVLDESEEHIGVKRPLVSFVDHHHAVASQVRLGEQLAEQHAVGHVLLHGVFTAGQKIKTFSAFLTLKWYIHPSTSSTTSARADASDHRETSFLCGHKLRDRDTSC